MHHHTLLDSLILLASVAATMAIFSFGKRKTEPLPEPEPIAPNEEEPVVAEEDGADRESETLPVLATFSVDKDQYEDRTACEQVWDALALPVRSEGADEPTRFFALTAFDPASGGRDAVAITACKLAQDATQRGYSVLLIDADVSHPTLHKLPLFAPRDGVTEPIPVGSRGPGGLADFLRGDTTRLEPVLKLAWRTEGLLLLPSGTADDDETLTGGATQERLLRLATPLAEIILVVAPPVFATSNAVRNQHILPKMDGVLVAYPSPFSAAGDTEALEKMEAINVPQVGAIVAPPVSFDDGDSPLSTATAPEFIPAFEVESVADVLETPTDTEPEVVAANPVFKTEIETAESDAVNVAESDEIPSAPPG
jgi:hypothetical protein